MHEVVPFQHTPGHGSSRSEVLKHATTTGSNTVSQHTGIHVVHWSFRDSSEALAASLPLYPAKGQQIQRFGPPKPISKRWRCWTATVCDLRFGDPPATAACEIHSARTEERCMYVLLNAAIENETCLYRTEISPARIREPAETGFGPPPRPFRLSNNIKMQHKSYASA
jgi:hypothetical protein